MRMMLIMFAALLSVACEPENITRMRSGKSDPSVIYILDAFGECYALRDMGRQQEWIPLKPEACRERTR